MSDAYRTFDVADSEARALYFQLTAIVVPRPIAWISTHAPDGTPNIAPFSFTTVLSSDPPIVCFVSSGVKDTMQNVEASGDFVYNLGGEELLERINLTSADLRRDESEFEWASLTPVPAKVVSSPRIGEAPISMECRLLQILPFGGGSGNLIAGEVVCIHIAERIFTGDRIDVEKLRPVSRLSGSLYARLGEVISIKRPNRQDLIDQGLRPE